MRREWGISSCTECSGDSLQIQMNLREGEKPSCCRSDAHPLAQELHRKHLLPVLPDENGQAEHHSAHWEQPHGTNHHQENPSSCHHAQRHGESLQKDFMQLNKTWPDAALINHWMSAPRGRTKPRKKMGFFDCLVGGYSFLLPSHYLWSNFSYNTSLSYILLSKHWEKMFFLFSCNNPDPSDKNIEAKQNSNQKRNFFWSPSKAQLFR